MDTFSIIRNALAASEDDDTKRGLQAREVETGRILAAVQTVVDALTPPDGGRYVVGFADISTAATSLSERRIVVSSKPLRDHTLSMVEKAVVIATFAAHEIGHTLVTRPRGMRIEQHNAKTGYHAVANIADDIILEPYMADRYPILHDAFAFTGLWVLRNTAKTLPKVERMRRDMKTAERFNVILSATRYGDIPEIVWDGRAAIAERDWARQWARDLIALDLKDHDGFLAACDVLWERIRSEADEDEPVETEPEPDEDGEPGDEPGEDESDEGQPGEDEGEDEGEDGESQPGDEPGDEQGEDEGEGGSDESDEDGEDEGQPGDEPGEDGEDGGGDEPGEGDGLGEQDDNPDWDDAKDGDEPGEDESNGTDGAGESDEDIGQDSDAIGTDPADGEDKPGEPGDIPDDADGGGGNSGANDAPLRDEDDFNDNEVEKSMHEQSKRERWDYDGEQAEQAARTYASTTVTAFGRHGSISTIWE